MSIELNKLAAEFNRYFTSANGVDVPERVSVSRDEWRQLHAALHAYGQATQAEVTDEQIKAACAEIYLSDYPHWSQSYDVAVARAVLALRPVSTFCEYCGGNDEDPVDHCMDCTRPAAVPMTDELCWQIWDKAGACDEVNERVTLKVAKPIIRAIVAAYLEVATPRGITAQAKKEGA